MSNLPSAVHQNPSCGACGDETTSDGDQFICEDCQLSYEPDNLSASFIDPDAKSCGASCTNVWHGDHKIRQGEGYDCGTCQLPAGHDNASWFHWTGCEPKNIKEMPRV